VFESIEQLREVTESWPSGDSLIGCNRLRPSGSGSPTRC